MAGDDQNANMPSVTSDDPAMPKITTTKEAGYSQPANTSVPDNIGYEDEPDPKD